MFLGQQLAFDCNRNVGVNTEDVATTVHDNCFAQDVHSTTCSLPFAIVVNSTTL